MFSRIQWRITFFSIFSSTLLLIILFFLLNRPGCLNSDLCVGRTILWMMVAFGLMSFLIGAIVASRTSTPLRNLTQIANRITDGDLNARLLPQTRDEVGTFTRAFNRMSEKLAEQLARLDEAHSQLATAVDYMADGVIVTDERGYVQLVNPAAARMLEIDREEVNGRSFAEVARHHQLIDLLQRCQQLGEEQTEAVEIGRELFLQTIMTPFRERNTLSYLVILQNLTPIRHLQTVRRDFISNISHELRTPLASLRAIVDTLQDHALEDSELAERFLQRAETEIDVMTQMVEELLELSRIESGQVPLQLSQTAVSDLILSPVERIREMAHRRQIELILDIPLGLPPVQADSNRIHQVITNLVHNAIKFTDEGGKITLKAFEDKKRFPGTVTITVADTGDGIPGEDIPRIFERFYKSDRARTRQRGGTGLGLAICKHIVELHNGRIWVKSKEGKGSTFYFTLPQT